MYFSKLNSLLILFVSVIAVLYALPNAVKNLILMKFLISQVKKLILIGPKRRIIYSSTSRDENIRNRVYSNTANLIRNDLRKEKLDIKVLIVIMEK